MGGSWQASTVMGTPRTWDHGHTTCSTQLHAHLKKRSCLGLRLCLVEMGSNCGVTWGRGRSSYPGLMALDLPSLQPGPTAAAGGRSPYPPLVVPPGPGDSRT